MASSKLEQLNQAEDALPRDYRLVFIHRFIGALSVYVPDEIWTRAIDSASSHLAAVIPADEKEAS